MLGGHAKRKINARMRVGIRSANENKRADAEWACEAPTKKPRFRNTGNAALGVADLLLAGSGHRMTEAWRVR